MSADFLAACALVLVFEGLAPAVMPRHWREAMRRATELSDQQLRIGGVVAMVAGLVLLNLVRGSPGA